MGTIECHNEGWATLGNEDADAAAYLLWKGELGAKGADLEVLARINDGTMVDGIWHWSRGFFIFDPWVMINR